MPTDLAVAPTAAPTPPVPAAPALAPGWKTTEMYAAVLAMGAIVWALQEVVRMLPVLASTPGMPAWAAPILALAPVGLGWLLKLTAGEYGKLRGALKLGAGDDVTAAINAGAVVQVADSASTAALGNR